MARYLQRAPNGNSSEKIGDEMHFEHPFCLKFKNLHLAPGPKIFPSLALIAAEPLCFRAFVGTSGAPGGFIWPLE